MTPDLFYIEEGINEYKRARLTLSATVRILINLYWNFLHTKKQRIFVRTFLLSVLKICKRPFLVVDSDFISSERKTETKGAQKNK